MQSSCFSDHALVHAGKKAAVDSFFEFSVREFDADFQYIVMGSSTRPRDAAECFCYLDRAYKAHGIMPVDCFCTLRVEFFEYRVKFWGRFLDEGLSQF